MSVCRNLRGGIPLQLASRIHERLGRKHETQTFPTETYKLGGTDQSQLVGAAKSGTSVLL